MDRPEPIALHEDRVADLRARWTPEATAAAVAFLESRPVNYDLPTMEHAGVTFLDLRGLRIEQTQIDKAFLRNVNLRWAVFRDVKLNAMSMGNFADAGELTYLEKTYERIGHFRDRHWGRWSGSLLQDLLWGYGERPWRLALAMAFNILLFGTLFHLLDPLP